MRRVLALSLAIGASALSPASASVSVPPPQRDVAAGPTLQTAVLAGGCFWGVETVFEHVRGVRSVTSGYAGGSAADAKYDRVSTERTGHAEAVRITFDPNQVSYGTLLRIFFAVAHDPTQVGGQGPDQGPSYRSAIFPQTSGQKLVASAYLNQLNTSRAFARPLTTRLESGAFYPAETLHQDFARKNPNHPYIVRWDRPKVAALRSAFPKLAI